MLRVRAGMLEDARDGVVEAEGFELENFDWLPESASPSFLEERGQIRFVFRVY